MCEKLYIGDSMKKIIKNIIFLTVLLITCNWSQVQGIQNSAYCVYEFSGEKTYNFFVGALTPLLEGTGIGDITVDVNFRVEVGVDDNGITISHNNNYPLGWHHYYFSHDNFVTNNQQYSCPSKMYVEIKKADSSYTLTSENTENIDVNNQLINVVGLPEFDYYLSKDELSSSDDIYELNLNTTQSKTYTVGSVETFNAIGCRYGDIILYINDDNVSAEYVPVLLFDSKKDFRVLSKVDLGFTRSDLSSTTCPSNIYKTLDLNPLIFDNNIIHLSLESTLLNQKIPLSATIQSATELGFTSGIELGDSLQEKPASQCNLLGDKLGSIIKWFVDLIQISIPIIIIIMTIVDFTGVVFSGEDKNFKAAGTKFVKRFIIGVAIILLPMLITFIIDMSGVLVPYGIDKNQLFCSIF